MVSVRVVTIVSIIGRGPAPGTLPPAVRLLNVWAVPCPFEAKAAVVNTRFAGVTLGPVFSQAGPDIIAARARGPIIPLFGTGLPLHSPLWPGRPFLFFPPLGGLHIPLQKHEMQQAHLSLRPVRPECPENCPGNTVEWRGKLVPKFDGHLEPAPWHIQATAE